MAPSSPRRSSRARFGNSHSHQPVGFSNSTPRFDRSTRSLNKGSPEKSTSRSLSSEGPDDLEDTLLSRRRKRGLEDDTDRATRLDNSDYANASDDLQDDEDDEEEDEAVRCLCGSDDYPGRPDVDGPDAEFFNSIELTDDVTGFFVQCDICKVWQHGACVGIFSAESSPDEYFCDQCRKDLHKIYTANDGQKYSRYLPLYRFSQPGSRAVSEAQDTPNSPKLGGPKLSRSEARELASKRRSTMNSRDAAYDDEQLRRAIEASREVMDDSTEGSITRRPKRGRSDSEGNQTSAKRQRTASHSPIPVEDPGSLQSREESDDDIGAHSGTRKSRGRAIREKVEKDDRERARQEAAVKRQGRADRRRAEDSDLSEENLANNIAKPTPIPAVADTESNTELPLSTTTSAPGTPPPSQPMSGNMQKKLSKSNQKRGRGKPQSVKDLDGDTEASPAPSASLDGQPMAEESAPTSNPKSPPGEQRHISKLKTSLANKLTMLDMKRRVAAIMEFISRTQLDLAAEAMEHASTSSSGNATPTKQISADEAAAAAGRVINEEDLLTGKKDFEKLTCIEMMDVLTRDMVKWQNQYS